MIVPSPENEVTPHDPAVHAPALPTTQSPLTGARPDGELEELLMTISPVAGHVTPDPPVNVQVVVVHETPDPVKVKAPAVPLMVVTPPPPPPLVPPPPVVWARHEEEMISINARNFHT
jgi:hypothetical protein